MSGADHRADPEAGQPTVGPDARGVGGVAPTADGAIDGVTDGVTDGAGQAAGPADVQPRVRRRRRANVLGGRHHSHRVKVTPEEEARLLVLAGEQRVSVPRLLVESALSAQGETPTQRRELLTELLALHRLVSNVANNVNQLARAANATGEINTEAVHYLRHARVLVGRIDDALDELGGA